MTTAQPDDEQLELMTSLLEGAEPGAYVVAPVGDLTRMLDRALFLTRDSRGNYRPGRASVRLVQQLLAEGHIVDTAHPSLKGQT